MDNIEHDFIFGGRPVVFRIFKRGIDRDDNLPA